MFQNKSKLREFFDKDWFCLILVFFVAVAVILPTIFLGIPEGDDDFPQHLQFARAYYDAISSGNYLPVWASADNYGFGSVGIRIYPPISAFVLALIKLATGNWFDAIRLSFFVWMFAGCIGIYFLAREWLAPKDSTIAAALYAFAPYHLLQIYQLWLYAEFVSAAILPFCFLFITRICRRGRSIDVVLFVIFYSLLLLSHIPSTIIGSLGLGIYALFLTDWRQYKKTLVNLFVAFIVSLSATAFYWIKIVTEINWANANNLRFSSGDYDPQQNLFPLFISVGKKYVQRVAWHFDITILLTILLFIPAIIYLGLQIKKNNFKEKKAILALAVTGLISIFMISLPSSLVWSSLPILPKVQFPWRWLSVLSIISVVIFAFAISRLRLESKYVKKVLAYSFSALFLVVLLFDITQSIIPSAPLSRSAFEAKLTEFFNKTGCECWWTKWSKREAFNQTEKVLADSRDVEIKNWENEKREFTVEQGQPTDVRVATFYYPYWNAEINGNQIKIEKDENGAIQIPVTSEKSTIKLQFTEPLFIKLAFVLSLLTWLLMITALLLLLRRNNYDLKTLNSF